MPLNYSKWDALELSDDSDIECHPNIDKKSFIRLKQRQIHEQREERKYKIQQLKREADLNATLLAQIKQFIEFTQKDGTSYLRQTASQLSQKQGAPLSGGQEPTMDQMVFSLITQVMAKIGDKSEGTEQDAAAEKELQFHFDRLTEREEKRKEELAKEEEEAHKHITSEDVYDGFNVSHIDKNPSAAIDEPLVKPVTKKKAKKTNIEVLNPEASGSQEAPVEAEDVSDSGDDDDEDLPKLSPSATKFARIKSSDYSSSLSAIQSDPSLYLEESTTDALLVEAFESEMKGEKVYAKNCVHQGLLLQYCRKLGRDGVSLFFKKIGSGEPKAMQVFIDDVNTTYDRIAARCQAINEERNQDSGTKEQIQLVPTNPSTSITFEVPDGPPPENLQLTSDNNEEIADIDIEEVRRLLNDRWETFNSFPKKLQKALKTKKLDKVNEALACLELAEAEKVVQDLDRVGILCFAEGGIVDATGTQEPKIEAAAQEQQVHPEQVVIPDLSS